MSCYPPLTAAPKPRDPLPDLARRRAGRLLAAHGSSAEAIPGVIPEDRESLGAAMATALMDLFRRTGDRAVFDALIELVSPQLLARVRSRLRHTGMQVDAHEVLQDAIVNIYRYPDRFDASRPGAFAAWSTTIVDNAVRRQLRRRRSGIEVALRPNELLCQHADRRAREPELEVAQREELAAAVSAFRVVLACYLAAYQQLSPRERWVLQEVEVAQRRYAELAEELGIRPEALKMVVFRARRRVLERSAQMLAAADGT